MSKDNKNSITNKELVQSIISDIYHYGDGRYDVPTEDGSVATKEVVFGDLITSKDLAPLIPEAVTNVMLEEIEPASVIVDNFFSQATITKSGSILITDTGPLTAGPIGSNGEYPSQGFGVTNGGYRISIAPQKYGLMIALQDSVIENNQLSIISLWLKKARNALIRNREYLAIRELLNNGYVMFDNSNPTGTGMWDIRNLTGRGIDGLANGTMSLNDLMEVYAYGLMEGFTFNVIGMNPLAWMTFMTDPEMREIVLNNNTVVSFKPPLGTRAKTWTLPTGNLGLRFEGGTGNPTLEPGGFTDPVLNMVLTKLGINPYARSMSALGATFNIPPRYFPTPLKIVVSPLFPLKKVGNKYITDIVFAESGEAGLFVRKESPMIDQLADSWKETYKIKVKEEISANVLSQGKAIRIIKNVVIDRNYVFDNVNSVSLTPIDRSAPLV